IREIGNDWRAAAITNAPLRKELLEWWNIVVSAADTEIARVCTNTRLCDALLELSAAADEACAGIRIRDPERAPDTFDIKANRLLTASDSITYCDQVHPSRAVVLPKLHTPRSGLTLRSLSHHLALISPGEVKTRWLWLPFETREWSLNLLLLPWPETVVPTD